MNFELPGNSQINQTYISKLISVLKCGVIEISMKSRYNINHCSHRLWSAWSVRFRSALYNIDTCKVTLDQYTGIVRTNNLPPISE